ncbi:hypothetical protein [Streptomyces lydicus]|uniref:hypothetical protein n=1 Tax=Streptomyces lydicus TaxID=47763 RepID=UPI003712AAA1
MPFPSLRLKLRQRRHNSTHARIRCLGEQAMAALKGWCLPRKLRCSSNRVTAIVKASSLYSAGSGTPSSPSIAAQSTEIPSGSHPLSSITR